MIRGVVRAAAGGAILVAAVVLSMAYGLVCHLASDQWPEW